MRARSSVAPRKAELDRGSRIGSAKEVDHDRREPLFTVPQLEIADVAFEIDGGRLDQNRVSGREALSVLWLRDCQTGLGDAVVADEYRRAFVRGINLEIVAGRPQPGGRTIRNGCYQRFDAFGYVVIVRNDLEAAGIGTGGNRHEQGRMRIIFTRRGGAGVKPKDGQGFVGRSIARDREFADQRQPPKRLGAFLSDALGRFDAYDSVWGKVVVDDRNCGAQVVGILDIARPRHRRETRDNSLGTFDERVVFRDQHDKSGVATGGNNKAVGECRIIKPGGGGPGIAQID